MVTRNSACSDALPKIGMAILESAQNKLRVVQTACGQLENSCVTMMQSLLLIMWECDGVMMMLPGIRVPHGYN